MKKISRRVDSDKAWQADSDAVDMLLSAFGYPRSIVPFGGRIIHFGVLTKDDYEETEETERPSRRAGVSSENRAPKLRQKGSSGDGSGDGKTEAIGATKQGVTT